MVFPQLRIAPRVLKDAVTTVVSNALKRSGTFDWPVDAGLIDAAWLTKVLIPAGSGARVTSFEVLARSVGTTNRTRLGLTYDSDEAGLPRSVFIKFSPNLPHRFVLNGMGMTDQEAWFYTDLRPLVPVSTPQLFAENSHPASGRFVLVLEDLAARGVRFNDATKALTRNEADGLVDSLASMHGMMWQHPRLDDKRFATPGHGRYADFYHCINWPLLRKAVKQNALDLLPPDLHDLKLVQKRFWQQLEFDSREPMTMIHGDCHAGNVYFEQDGTPGFYDWQIVRRGSWVYDFGYCLMSILAVDDRRDWEKDLLARYLDGLGRHGVSEVPTFDEAFHRYRRQSAYGLVAWLVTLGGGDFQDVDISSEAIRRFGQAANDHGSMHDENLWR